TGGDAGDGGDGAAVGANCGALVCTGNGRCVEAAGVAKCVCDEGYRPRRAGDAWECVVDESCIRVKFLQKNSCRYRVAGAPAVGLFFAVDYCSGTAVLPEKLGDLSSAFVVTEDGADVKLNPESFATVIDRDIEAYVTLAIDVSTSLTQDSSMVTRLVAELRRVVTGLQGAPGAPPVMIGIHVFGRFVREYLPYTSDPVVVEAALSAIERDPTAVTALVDGGGTAVYEATATGIRSVERIQALRDAVTDGGVLTTGTVVVVTDGRDTSGRTLDTALIAETKVNVISIGISGEIDDDALTGIGRDGSFLAPTPDAWTSSFGEIARRVKEYPERVYLLGYCSSASVGRHTVEVGLAAPLRAEAAASCSFDASAFGSDPEDTCNAAFFKNECAGLECGGFVGCGACPDEQCCVDGRCQAPSAVPADGDCREHDALCRAEGKVCQEVFGAIPRRFGCAVPLGVGGDCTQPGSRCAPGEAQCVPGAQGTRTCGAVFLENGDVCGTGTDIAADRCPELNCAKKKAESAAEPFVCLPEARAFDRCAGDTARAVCESGTECQQD
ncbi:MAG: VWA domain-containing protein, partial [Deltaproteobacteria bacterium]|nr:VWA domain-containing protein [Deltaproteobacteria bacterium]